MRGNIGKYEFYRDICFVFYFVCYRALCWIFERIKGCEIKTTEEQQLMNKNRRDFLKTDTKNIGTLKNRWEIIWEIIGKDYSGDSIVVASGMLAKFPDTITITVGTDCEIVSMRYYSTGIEEIFGKPFIEAKISMYNPYVLKGSQLTVGISITE
jgi:hypothetical protein